MDWITRHRCTQCQKYSGARTLRTTTATCSTCRSSDARSPRRLVCRTRNHWFWSMGPFARGHHISTQHHSVVSGWIRARDAHARYSWTSESRRRSNPPRGLRSRNECMASRCCCLCSGNEQHQGRSKHRECQTSLGITS